jgi:hypothetical protein
VLFYVDGHVYTPLPNGKLSPRSLQAVRDTQISNLDELPMEDFAAMEVYSRAQAPQQFRPLGDYCKVVLLWSRW